VDINLRKATLADAKEIANIHVISWKTSFAGLMPEKYISGHTESSRVDEWKKIISMNVEKVVVAESNNKVLGFMSFSVKSQVSRELELSKLYLFPSVYGKNLGSKFMHFLQTEATAQGVNTINLYVLDNNEPAIRFYSKHGFEFVDGYVSEEFEGETIIDLKMTKRV